MTFPFFYTHHQTVPNHFPSEFFFCHLWWGECLPMQCQLPNIFFLNDFPICLLFRFNYIFNFFIFIFFYYFDVLILKINLKNKKYFIDIFLKIHFKKQVIFVDIRKIIHCKNIGSYQIMRLIKKENPIKI